MTIFGMMRIKNEGRWIREVVNAALPICERIFVLDDHSNDGTDEICESMGEKVTVYRSQFEGLDESRDKSYLLERIMNNVSDRTLQGNTKSPFWVLAIDGDEVLAPGSIEQIQQTLNTDVVKKGHIHAFKLPITYLWNSRATKRVDGVYERFARPSLFRIMNKAFQFQQTPWGGNFHCSSIPQELLHHAHGICPAPLLHLGYMSKEDRIRKYKWYTTIDPNNEAEDCYRHIVQGDVPEIPADAKLLHAGPLKLVTV